VYKLDSFVGFIGDEQLHAQECYAVWTVFVYCSQPLETWRIFTPSLLGHRNTVKIN
jgi:hypothetical protein